MKTLYIERSTGEERRGDWSAALDVEGIERIVVGTGPGSFAGVRSALAFAQGYALGRKVGVFGLPSPCAQAVPGRRRAVVGDARRGKIWIALLDSFALAKEVFQVEAETLFAAVPTDFEVVSPDHRRIGDLLQATFGERYLGEEFPTAEGLQAFAEANPGALVTEPLPIYLNPAVRP